MFLSTFLVSTIGVLALIFYYPFIFLNLTFTHDNLIVADVPYYTTPVPRFGFDWWIIALSAWHILPPFFQLLVLGVPLSNSFGKSEATTFTTIGGAITIISWGISLFHVIYFSFVLIYCDSTNPISSICRSFDGIGGTNFVFDVMYGFSWGFLVYFYILLFWFGRSYRKYVKNTWDDVREGYRLLGRTIQ